MGFPGGTSDKESACQCRRHKRCRFNPRVRKIPGGEYGDTLHYYCLEKSNGQRRLVSYSTWGPKESDMTEHTHHIPFILLI